MKLEATRLQNGI